MWTKRSKYAPKSRFGKYIKICLKRGILGFFFMLDLLPLFSPSFPIIMVTFFFGGGGEEEEEKDDISLSWSPNIYSKRTSFGLSQCKTQWTSIMDNVSMETWLLGTLSSMVTLTFVFLM